MKFFKDIFKKIKPIYIILALFVVVIVISALGSRTTKEGMESYSSAELTQSARDDRDTTMQELAFLAQKQQRDSSGFDSINFLNYIIKYLNIYSTFKYQQFVQQFDINNDGILIVDSTTNKFIRDNDSSYVLAPHEKILRYKPLKRASDVTVSQSDVDIALLDVTAKINTLNNTDDIATMNSLIKTLAKKNDDMMAIINANSPIESFEYYEVPYSYKVALDSNNNTTLRNSDETFSMGVGASNPYTPDLPESPPYSDSTRGDNGHNRTERARARERARAKAELELAELKKLAEKASQVPPAPYVQWEASSCGDDTTLASAASIACINSLWKGYGCTPNLVNTSNPNYLLDSNTNQLYDIANQTLGQMKVLMAKTSHNPTYCYGSVSPGAASSGVNATSADYWKNLYLSAVSVPNANANVPNANANASNTDSCTAGSQSYNSLFIPSDAPLAGTGVGTGGAGSGTGTGTGTGAGTDNSGNSTSSNSSNSTVSGGSSDGEPLSDQDMYLLSNQSPSDCPVGASGTAGSCGNNIKSSPVPPCPPCERCPEPSFDCKKVPTYNSAANNQYLPQPVLADFSQFGM